MARRNKVKDYSCALVLLLYSPKRFLIETDVSRPDEHAARVGTVGFKGSKASCIIDALMTSKLSPSLRSTLPVMLLSMPRRGTQVDRTYDSNAERRVQRRSTP